MGVRQARDHREVTKKNVERARCKQPVRWFPKIRRLPRGQAREHIRGCEKTKRCRTYRYMATTTPIESYLNFHSV